MKKIKLTKKKKEEINLCPKCLKPALKSAFNVSGWLSNQTYNCTNCHYVGNFFVTIDIEEYNAKKELIVKEEIDK